MLDADTLLQRAAEAEGTDDYGDPSFRDGLAVLVGGLNDEARLSNLGAVMAESILMSTLANRLRVEAWHRDHPELVSQQIEAPIVIVGMSRSGTTLLSHLLGKDDQLRSLLRWEALDSVPPPQSATYADDPRYHTAVEMDVASDLVLPGFKALHHDPPDAPVECNTLLAHTFNSTVFPTVYFVPSYFRWIMSADPGPSYAYHHRMLQLLQSHAPGRWTLKGPQHGYALEAFRKVYPDATFIVTHRDPAICTASTASLITFLNEKTSDGTDRRVNGEVTTEFIAHCADGLLDYHHTHGPTSMIHVSYPDLVREPMAIVRDIYDQLNQPLRHTVELQMTALIAERPQHQHGVHRYTAADFGLDRAELDQRFSRYRETFDVAREQRD
jgi:LPS sulfotransferase NodH